MSGPFVGTAFSLMSGQLFLQCSLTSMCLSALGLFTLLPQVDRIPQNPHEIGKLHSPEIPEDLSKSLNKTELWSKNGPTLRFSVFS